jgi:N-acetylglucosamine malate deacetylase 1
MSQSIDLVVFGPHPDDSEIGMGATIAKHVADGKGVGLCDLSRGELGTNGTVEERAREADAAAKVLGVAWRENLGWQDGGMAQSPELIRSAAAFLRRRRPRAIAVPYWQDRHPDHRAASDTLTIATFRSGLRKFDTGEPGDPWRPEWICYYFINDGAEPSFVVDVSAHYDRKREALACYPSQFTPRAAGAQPTRLTASTFMQLIESRDAHFGARTGVAFAEGFVVREPLVRPSLLKSIS